MDLPVIRIRHKSEVLNPVVMRVFVYMMNMLISFQGTIQMLLHYPSMLINSLLFFFEPNSFISIVGKWLGIRWKSPILGYSKMVILTGSRAKSFSFKFAFGRINAFVAKKAIFN